MEMRGRQLLLCDPTDLLWVSTFEVHGVNPNIHPWNTDQQEGFSSWNMEKPEVLLAPTASKPEF